MIRAILDKLASEDDYISQLEAGNYDLLKDKTCAEIKELINSMQNTGQEGARVSQRIWSVPSISIKTDFI
jgi:hypothetical protein